MKISIKNPKRLFTFGCSFTHYRWASWANILAYELNCDFYNFGKSGAGNSYIANQITQANNHFKFSNEDLVVVCWTNVSREDRWHPNNGWITPGNIYTQGEYDKKFVKRWANDIHFVLRDFSIIDLASHYLKNQTNYHFLSMCNISTQINQWENTEDNKNPDVQKIAKSYSNVLSTIARSFYEVLWNNNIDNKWSKDWQEIHPHYSDGHPTPIEHLEYLESIFEHNFSNQTKEAVFKLNQEWINFIRESYQKTKTSQGLHDLDQNIQEKLYKQFRLRKENRIPTTIWH